VHCAAVHVLLFSQYLIRKKWSMHAVQTLCSDLSQRYVLWERLTLEIEMRDTVCLSQALGLGPAAEVLIALGLYYLCSCL